MDDGVIEISLQKAKIGQVWDCACAGVAGAKLTETERTQEQQRVLLERFQREHPNFDFSNATFSGQAPDPSSFMGGIDRNSLAKP
jgi:hypothetical protein